MATEPNTLLEMSRSLRLYIPDLPITLAEQFIRDRYRRILEARDWSGLRREAEFHLDNQKNDGTVDVTRNDDEVIGNGTTFAATDVGRQFKVGQGSPIYTITAVDVGLQVLTLDRTFGPATATDQTYFIVDAYVTPPSDFLRFLTIVDPLQGWRLRHWITSMEMATIDPQRVNFGNPYILADRMYNVETAGASMPVPQYEAWPYNTTARTLYYTYKRRGADLIQATDIPIWPIRSDAIVSGALADAARWPGTTANPNPYFKSPQFWKTYDDDYRDKMIEIERVDEDIYSTMLIQWPYSQVTTWAPLSAQWIQQHAL